MGLERKDMSAEAAALAWKTSIRDLVNTSTIESLTQEQRVNESSHTRADLDGSSSSVIENTKLEGPSLGSPNPVNDRAVAVKSRV